MAERRIGALILAAGLSSRMGSFKPLLKIGDKTLLDHAVRLFSGVGLESVVTVVGYRAEEMMPNVEALGSLCVINANYQEGMFSSIRQGVHTIKTLCDAFFLLPVDIPLVLPATVMKMMRIFQRDPSVAVCYPCFKAQRGHPPLINCLLANSIIDYDGNDGMRGFLRVYSDRAVEVKVDDPFIHLDADYPNDLASLRDNYWQSIQRYKVCSLR